MVTIWKSQRLFHCQSSTTKLVAVLALAVSASTLGVSASIAIAESPQDKIDRFVSQRWQQANVQPAVSATDQEWVRRVYLDLAGRIPTLRERDNFIADRSHDRRERLVDTLLASEDYAQHFADVFDVLLMGRAKESVYAERTKHRWRGYLETVFRDNRPWDDVAAEILLGRPVGKHDQGAAWFLYERKDKYQEIAEAVAPAFFGIRIECAQCHDHMMADEILQEHYWGLVAFYNRGKNKKTPNGPRVAESAVGGFSEFADIHGSSSPNLLSFINANVVNEKRPAKDEKSKDADELYLTSRQKNEPRVPKFSRRQAFVEKVVAGHPRIAPAFVNRVWAMLMGRGLVHPFDKMDSVHEPSHPELLNWLSSGFEYSGFDVRQLVRAIVLTNAYGLSSSKPDGIEDPATFAWYLERPLTAEQWARSIQVALRGNFRNDHEIVKQLRQQFVDVLPEENVTGVKDTLFLANNPALVDFVAKSSDGNHLPSQLLKQQDNAQRIQMAFETLFGRTPVASEQATVAKFLAKHHDRKGLDNMLWAMLTSAEFRMNH